MNNFHIYEEVGRGKYSVVYKVSLLVAYNDAGAQKEDDWLRSSQVSGEKQTQEGA